VSGIFGTRAWMARELARVAGQTKSPAKAAAARAIEPLCQLWCIPGFLQNRWTHAFKVLWE
jgi:hypothetical protein